MCRTLRLSGWGLAAASALLATAGCGEKSPYEASSRAAAVDANINWSRAELIAVQDAGRYKTLDSFAREAFAEMTGDEQLPGLSPLASLFEWLFNFEAYVDVPLIKVGSAGVRAAIVQPFREADRQRILDSKRFTLREIFHPQVDRVLGELEMDPMKRRAVNRVRAAQGYASRLSEFVSIVPQPHADAVAPWGTPQQTLANLTDAQLAQIGVTRADLPAEARQPIPHLSPEQALQITVMWTSLRQAWLQGDAAGVQRYVDQLADTLPELAAAGVYPSHTQRSAEARYYRFGKFTSGWMLYFLAFLVSIWALVTRWRTPWILTIVLLVAALSVHAYGLALRWYILDRIPVANMFEAVVGSAWVGIAIAVLIELSLKTRVFLTAAGLTGFLALVMGGYILPGAELGTIPAILDDIQLRIHTVLIISSYSLIFLAAVVGVVYLLGYFGLKLARLVRYGLTAELPGSGPLPALAPAMAGAAVGVGGDVRAAPLSGPEPMARTAGARAAVAGERPLLAGAGPSDATDPANGLPKWLNDIDLSHMTIINLVFVLLFLGTITGAWWADYSWGRPWGWDPKEVFALNTWIIYAILVHARFVTRNRGLWTAWLSILGCGMMAFNWFFVNFFIASVHSYV